ncbi:MAG: hypothetical protein WKF61_03510 [Luteimonas sp.]
MAMQFTVDLAKGLSAKDAKDAKKGFSCGGTLINRLQGKVRSAAPSSQPKPGSILTLLFAPKAEIKMDPSLRWDDEQNPGLQGFFSFASFASFADASMLPSPRSRSEIRQELHS